MGKDKIRRFAAVKNFDNFFELPDDYYTAIMKTPFPMKGKWRGDFFKNDRPIVLELGCGKGEYTVGLAKHFPDKNFVGMDIKGNRMYIGAKEALDEKMENVAFMRARIDFIDHFFGKDEIDEIWLTFSDPQPKKPRKRLSSPLFIGRYRQVLKAGGLIHMKTDSDILFEYTEEQIEEQKYVKEELTWDLYGSLPETIDQQTREIFHIKTHYEKLFTSKGSTIKYCRFRVS